jgi:hypothetical protein
MRARARGIKGEITILKKTDDPTGTVRVSLGGSKEMGGYYCVYRGRKEDALECLNAALLGMQTMVASLGPDKEPDIAPDDGKQYA